MKQTLDLTKLTQALRKAPKISKADMHNMVGTDYLVQQVLLPVCYEKAVSLQDLDFDRFDEADIEEMRDFLKHGYPSIMLLHAAEVGKPALLQHAAAFC